MSPLNTCSAPAMTREEAAKTLIDTLAALFGASAAPAPVDRTLRDDQIRLTLGSEEVTLLLDDVDAEESIGAVAAACADDLGYSPRTPVTFSVDGRVISSMEPPEGGVEYNLTVRHDGKGA